MVSKELLMKATYKLVADPTSEYFIPAVPIKPVSMSVA